MMHGNHMVVHPFEGSDASEGSTSISHHASRGVLAAIHATMTSRKSNALLYTMVMTIK